MACIDMHALACILICMTHKLHLAITEFQRETGLSDHRIGILATGNGRLIERLARGGRVWPETEIRAWAFLQSDRAKAILKRCASRRPERQLNASSGGV